MTPSNVIISLDKVKDEMNKASLPSLVNNQYITTQLGLHFKVNKEEMIDKFKANYLVLVSDPQVLAALGNADKFSIITSLLNITKDGLSINPYDKEAAIVNYGGKAVAVPMAKGKIKKLQNTGVITRIQYLEIIYQGDLCTNKNGIWEHSINIVRADDAKMLGVLLIMLMPDNTLKSKFVSAKEVNKRKEKSKMKGSIWVEWVEEMWKKTAINMFEKEIGGKPQFQFINESEIEEHDTENIQETNYIVATEDVIVQSLEIRAILDSLILEKIIPQVDEDRLLSKLESMTDEQMNRTIQALEARKEAKEVIEVKVSENEPPI